ncbi:MAG: dTMP kinase [Bdellovibrionota bacterium]
MAKFITVEGGEGVGKSSFLAGLVILLEELSIDVVQTREPGGTVVADRLRDVFSHPPENETLLVESEFLIVSAARAQHTWHKIIPSLKSGKWVLSDRYADSSRVYQGYLGGLDASFIEEVAKRSTFGIEPDLTFILDCDVELALERVNARRRLQPADDTAVERYDAAMRQIHEKIRSGFLELRKCFPDRMVVLDSRKSVAEIVQDAMQIIKKRFDINNKGC